RTVEPLRPGAQRRPGSRERSPARRRRPSGDCARRACVHDEQCRGAQPHPTRTRGGYVTMLETPRLVLRELQPDDAEFIVALLNVRSFLQYIGGRTVGTADGARRCIAAGPAGSSVRNGFGVYLVERRSDGEPIGMCGLLRRETLPDVD